MRMSVCMLNPTHTHTATRSYMHTHSYMLVFNNNPRVCELQLPGLFAWYDCLAKGPLSEHTHIHMLYTQFLIKNVCLIPLNI